MCMYLNFTDMDWVYTLRPQERKWNRKGRGLQLFYNALFYLKNLKYDNVNACSFWVVDKWVFILYFTIRSLIFKMKSFFYESSFY